MLPAYGWVSSQCELHTGLLSSLSCVAHKWQICRENRLPRISGQHAHPVRPGNPHPRQSTMALFLALWLTQFKCDLYRRYSNLTPERRRVCTTTDCDAATCVGPRACNALYSASNLRHAVCSASMCSHQCIFLSFFVWGDPNYGVRPWPCCLFLFLSFFGRKSDMVT